MADDALDFGSGNSSRYYAFSGPTLPDADWCVGCWVRMPNGMNTSADFQYLISAGTIGAANSFHIFFGDSSNQGQVLLRGRGAAGTEWNWGFETAIGSAPNYIDTTNRLMIVQRRGSAIEGYWVAKGAAVAGPNSTTGLAGNTTISPATWNFGRRPDGNATRYFGNVAGELFMLSGDSLNAAEVEALAAGVHIDAVRTTRLLDLRFRGSNAVEQDLSGNDYDATRNGAGWALVEEFFPDADAPLIQAPPAFFGCNL